MKLILRLWRAKLAFHPLSPKKKHSINAHYAETWGLFEIASLFAIFVCAFVCAPPPHLPAPSSASFPLPRPPAPAPPLRACTCSLTRALAHTRTSADFLFLPSPFTALSQLTVYQHIRGEHLPHTIPFTYPSPSLSRFSPTGYGKVPLFPTLPPYFSRHSPCLANCKISHRAGEGIFLKAFTPYALIYCTLRPTGEEVKEKNENHLTRARGKPIFKPFCPDANLPKRNTSTLNKFPYCKNNLRK